MKYEVDGIGRRVGGFSAGRMEGLCVEQRNGNWNYWLSRSNRGGPERIEGKNLRTKKRTALHLTGPMRGQGRRGSRARS